MDPVTGNLIMIIGFVIGSVLILCAFLMSCFAISLSVSS